MYRIPIESSTGRASVVSQINFDKQTCFSLGTFPSLQRGGCGINQKSRSHRRAADGVVAHATRFTNAFRSIACERPPRPRLFSERIHFANGASTPPLQGGECTYPKSVSNMKWDTTLAQVLVAQDSGNGFRLHHGADDCFGNCFGREGADGAVVGRDGGCSG